MLFLFATHQALPASQEREASFSTAATGALHANLHHCIIICWQGAGIAGSIALQLFCAQAQRQQALPLHLNDYVHTHCRSASSPQYCTWSATHTATGRAQLTSCAPCSQHKSPQTQLPTGLGATPERTTCISCHQPNYQRLCKVGKC